MLLLKQKNATLQKQPPTVCVPLRTPPLSSETLDQFSWNLVFKEQLIFVVIDQIERHYRYLLHGSEMLYSNTSDVLLLRQTLLYCVKEKLIFYLLYITYYWRHNKIWYNVKKKILTQTEQRNDCHIWPNFRKQSTFCVYLVQT